MFGCSNDDGSGGQLQKIERRNYTGDPEEAIQQYRFSNGKLIGINLYNSSNFITGEIKYKYFSNGLLRSISKPENRGGVINIYARSFIYDNQERIMFMKYFNKQSDESYYVNYTYNNDSTITAESFGTTEGVKTYYVNEDNLIYKEVSESNTYEVVFDGYNATLGSSGLFASRTFEYSNEVALFNINYFTGGYASNGVLMYNSLLGNETAASNNYVTQENGVDNLRYEYIFDGNGNLKTRIDYENDNLISELQYEY